MVQSVDPTDLLQEVLTRTGDTFCELRYHKKRSRAVSVEKGRVDTAQITEHTGVGVRVLLDGTWGFASTDRLESGAIEAAVAEARAAARASASARRDRIAPLPAVDLARGRFDSPGFEELMNKPIEETLAMVRELEATTRGSSALIRSAGCTYTEAFEEKGIVTTDGAKAWTRLVRPEFRVMAVAEKAGEIQNYRQSSGATGGWDCLFRKHSAGELAEKTAQRAIEMLSAGHPEGGRKRVLLSPQIVGILTHEAVGHTVEADFVLSGSCAANRIGTRVASELITLCDSGISEYYPGAGGSLQVDDEGVRTKKTTIIEQGKLVSYLHDRETAAHFEVEPTGNARAWEYDDAPLIRMRNTYIAPGESEQGEMIENIEDGLLLHGALNGQADANGEFMFGTAEAYPIHKGKLGRLMHGVNISGLAFDVLSTVDQVGKDFEWDLGAGHCGKGQPAKVDAGGPWISCEVVVGGREA